MASLLSASTMAFCFMALFGGISGYRVKGRVKEGGVEEFGTNGMANETAQGGTTAAVGVHIRSDGSTSRAAAAAAVEKKVAALQRRSNASAGDTKALKEKDQCIDEVEKNGGCETLQETESVECADVAQEMAKTCTAPAKPFTPLDSSLAGKVTGRGECCGANNPVCKACEKKMTIQSYCASPSASPDVQQCPRSKADKVEWNVEYVEMPHDVKIRILVQRPKPDDRKYPLIILLASWGMSLEMYGLKPNEWASYGYVVVSMDMRGFGPFFKSDKPSLGKGAPNSGIVDVAGEPTQADVGRVITHMISKPFVDESRVGLGGISYGAINALIAASKDARVKAVVAIGGTLSIQQDLSWNGAQNTHWLNILVFLGKMGSNNHLDQEVLTQLNRLKEHSDSDMDSFLNWCSTRLTDLDGLKTNNPAVLVMQGMFDDLFHSQYVFEILKLVSRSKVRMVGEGHLPLGMLLEGLAPGTTNMGWKMWDESLAWFDTYLKDAKEVSSPAVKLQVTNEDHTYPLVEFSSWPPANVTMYLVPTSYTGSSIYAIPYGEQPRHELTMSVPATPNADRTALLYDKSLAHHLNKMESPAFPMISNMFKHGSFDLATTPMNLLEKEYNLVYLSERYDMNQRLCGVSSVRDFVVYPSKLPVQMFFYLYDIEDNGVSKQGKLINYAVYAVWPGQEDAFGNAAAVDHAFHLPDVEFKTACYNFCRKEEAGQRPKYWIALGVDLYDANFDDIMKKDLALDQGDPKVDVSYEKKPHLDLPLVSIDTC
eukprot:TRINITY_DN6572_c0_g1_i2.p1 TRINITY_DN6572_c0_g1~~TRINITY_DN6572_c0_g1_i2.p1  ORF type:complete len:794 (-),score=102.83 TRINITY_DN6572_c0_g1_i2:291-2594(-)